MKRRLPPRYASSQGKLRAIGASNLDAQQMRDALDVAAANGLPATMMLQPEYNLYDRASMTSAAQSLHREEIGRHPYFSLQRLSFRQVPLTQDLEGSARGGGVEKYLDGRGMRILGVLDEIAEETGAKQAEIALAWIIARDGVTAPIASATNADQLASLVEIGGIDVAGRGDKTAERSERIEGIAFVRKTRPRPQASETLGKVAHAALVVWPCRAGQQPRGSA